MSGNGGIVLVVGTVMYFAPVVVAGARGHRQVLAIGVLNLFLGWTVLGWAVALVWACVNSSPAVGPPAAAAPIDAPSVSEPGVAPAATLSHVGRSPGRPLERWELGALAAFFAVVVAVMLMASRDGSGGAGSDASPAWLDTPSKLLNYCAVGSVQARRLYSGAAGIEAVAGDDPMLSSSGGDHVVTCQIKSPDRAGWMTVRATCQDVFKPGCVEPIAVSLGGELLSGR